MRRRSFLKGLAAAAALTLARLVPDLAPKREPELIYGILHFQGERIPVYESDFVPGGEVWMYDDGWRRGLMRRLP